MNGSLLPPPPPPPPVSFSGANPAVAEQNTDTTSTNAARRSTRACDACRRRKVRCNGASPRCQQCAHLDITCLYTPTGTSRRSRKSAAPRGTVIAACRSGSFTSNTSTSQSTPTPPLPLSRFTPLSPGGGVHLAHSPSAVTQTSDNSSPGVWSPELSMRTPTFNSKNLSAQFFLDLLPEYLMMVYPVNPIMPEWEIRDLILNRNNQDSEILAFLYAYAAVTINLSSVDRPDRKDKVSSLLHATLENSRRLTHLDPPPSAIKIVTYIFIEVSLSGINKADLAMIYLREAIGMILLRRIHQPEVMAKVEPLERSRLERLYWECFIHERFYAVSGDKDILLDPLPHMPEWDPSQPYSSYQIHYGWICTIQIFSLIDKDFIMYWLRRHTPPREWVQQRHRELEDTRWKTQIESLLPMSQADLIVTRHWLRTSLWQIAIRNMILSSVGSDGTIETEAPSLTLPAQLSEELKPFLESFSLEEVAVHGTGVVFKLFEITNAIIDVITQLPLASMADKRKRLEDLLTLKVLILRFSRIEGMHRRILEQKFEKVRALHAQACEEDERLGELVSQL